MDMQNVYSYVNNFIIHYEDCMYIGLLINIWTKKQYVSMSVESRNITFIKAIERTDQKYLNK